MKKYFFGVKNILLLILSILPLVSGILAETVFVPYNTKTSRIAENEIMMAVLCYLLRIFLIPYLYIFALVLILLLSRDFRHWLILDMILMISMLVFLFVIMDKEFAKFASLGFVLNFLGITLAIHGGLAVLKWVILRHKKSKSHIRVMNNIG